MVDVKLFERERSCDIKGDGMPSGGAGIFPNVFLLDSS